MKGHARRICDDQVFIDRCVVAIGWARTSDGKRVKDVLDVTTRYNIILQLTEATELIQERIDRGV